jgi:hypothetical protein
MSKREKTKGTGILPHKGEKAARFLGYLRYVKRKCYEEKFQIATKIKFHCRGFRIT